MENDTEQFNMYAGCIIVLHRIYQNAHLWVICIRFTIPRVSETLPRGANQRLHNVPADKRHLTGEPIRLGNSSIMLTCREQWQCKQQGSPYAPIEKHRDHILSLSRNKTSRAFAVWKPASPKCILILFLQKKVNGQLYILVNWFYFLLHTHKKATKPMYW